MTRCKHSHSKEIGQTVEGLGTVLLHWCPDCGALKWTMTNWKYTSRPWQYPRLFRQQQILLCEAWAALYREFEYRCAENWNQQRIDQLDRLLARLDRGKRLLEVVTKGVRDKVHRRKGRH